MIFSHASALKLEVLRNSCKVKSDHSLWDIKVIEDFLSQWKLANQQKAGVIYWKYLALVVHKLHSAVHWKHLYPVHKEKKY